MRPLVRLTLIIGLVGVVALVAPEARADVVFAESAQEAFGVDENGEDAGPGKLSKMWEAFIAQEEGRRILEKLEESDATITIEVLPDEHVSNGTAYGTTRGLDWDGDTPNRIEIKLARDGHKGVLEGADTIHHEMRHAEIKLDGGHVFGQTVLHDLMHAGVDSWNNLFQSQLGPYIADTLARDPFYLSETPISDRIKARADDDTFFRYTAIDISDILIPIPSDEELRRTDVVEVNGVRIRTAIATELDGSAAAGSGCGTSEGDRTIICPEGAGELNLDDLLGIGVHLDGVLLDSNVEIRLEMDTDGDPANDRESQNDTDTSGGTDTTFGALYDPIQGWSMQVYGALGPISSNARAIVESGSVTFLVSMDEVPGGTAAGFRVAAEQTTPDGVTSVDVVGTTTDPLAAVPDGPVAAGCGEDFLGPVCGAQSQTHISQVLGHVDLAGDFWLEMVFEGPWAMVPPNELASILVSFGITTTSGTSRGQWSVHDGITYASGIYGKQPTELEMYLTPWGSVFIKMLGRDAPGSFSLDDHGPLVVNTLTRYLLTLDGVARERMSNFPLTSSRIFPGFAGPGVDWTAVLVDVGLIILVVPGG
jgi:hypothetical protein